MIPCAMIANAIVNLPSDTVKHKGVRYLNLPCGFDIETTSQTVGDSKVAHMYIWMIGLGHNNGVYYGRTWEEFTETCDLISRTLNLGDKKRLVIYVHNLAYEFQFMRKYFDWDDTPFSIDERKPIKALTTSGIEFRDSYILSGMSLALTAKNLVKHKVAKMAGDLDYKLSRHHETPLTAAEMGYCENDIAVITAYIDEQISQYGSICKIPATNTGRVREKMRDNCLMKRDGKPDRNQFKRYEAIMKNLTMSPEVYQQANRTFMGGFTHANANHTGKTLHNVSSVDFTSSYPSVMLSEKFPMSRFKPIEINTAEELKKYCSQYAVMMDATFTDIESAIPQECYLSVSKCRDGEEIIENNGRVAMAKKLTISVTEIDLEIIFKAYKFTSITISNAMYAHKNYLPKPVVQTVLEMYQKKTTLKDVKGMEAEYLNEKGMLNSTYGMCVTDPVKDETIYEDGEWFKEHADLESSIGRYNADKKRVLYYPWGLWVTAYARRNLWTGIFEMGNDYVYSDTDSLKVLNYDAHKPYFKSFDDAIIKRMEDMCDFYKLDKSLLCPKTKDGVVKMIGVWDYEGTYDSFKTLGAKRYLQLEKGKLKLTVAGLSKQNGINYLKKLANDDVNEVFNIFNDKLYIPAEQTGKMTHTYQDDTMQYQCTDYLGNTQDITSESGVHLEPCEFTLSLSETYLTFITNLKSGRLYKGAKNNK